MFEPGPTPAERERELKAMTREQLVLLLLEAEQEKAHLIGAMKDSWCLMMGQKERAETLEARVAAAEILLRTGRAA